VPFVLRPMGLALKRAGEIDVHVEGMARADAAAPPTWLSYRFDLMNPHKRQSWDLEVRFLGSTSQDSFRQMGSILLAFARLRRAFLGSQD